MKTQGYTILALGCALVTVGCSGTTYQVGTDPGSAGASQAGSSSSSGGDSGASGPIGSQGGAEGGSAAQGGSTAQAGGTAVSGGAASDAHCGFAPATQPGPAIGATTEVVLKRVQLFLDDSADQAPPTNLPVQATPALASALAMAILDDHLASQTEAPGLARFLKAWLKLPLEAGVDTEAAHTWALKLVDPDATLSTLLAEPTGEPHRIGILTDPQVLSARPTISQRGAWIQANVLCQAAPPPPAGIENPDPATVKGVTRREKLEYTLSDPSCRACHAVLDPTGDALEHFDAMGNYRETDGGKAVDSAASITTPMALSFDSIEDLAPALATSCAVAQCFTRNVMKDAFTVNGMKFTDSDVNQVANAFADGDFSIRELVKAIVTSPAFLH